MKSFTLLSLIIFITSCKKENTPAPPPNPSEVTTKAIQGQWAYNKLIERTIEKSAQGGVILKPDGTPVDTIRNEYILSGSYWKFNTNLLTVYENRNNNGFGFEDKGYEVNNEGKTIQVTGRLAYAIEKLTKTELVLSASTTSQGGNGRYTEIYWTFHLSK